jgi:vacuolar-type H+-ATPase subunit H
MIGELLGAIKQAEDTAAQIITAANAKAAKIADEATQEIEKIDAKTADEIVKIMSVPDHEIQIQSTTEIKIEVPKDKYAAAKKLIIEGFHKRWAK